MTYHVAQNFSLAADLDDGTTTDHPVVGWHNVVTLGGLEATSENTDYPVRNLANPMTFPRWKSLISEQQSLRLATNYASEIDYVGFAAHNFGSEGVAVTVYGDRPADSTEKIRLEFTGADGSTTIADENIGGSAHTWTANGNAQIDTTTYKFGGSALLLDGTGDYVTTPDHADFTLGSGDFTVDCWFTCLTTGGSVVFLAGQGDNGGTVNANTSIVLYRTSGNFMACDLRIGGATETVIGTTQFTNLLNTGWHHLAVVRSTTTLRLFIDGVQEDSEPISGTVQDSANAWSIGRWGEFATTPWNGSVDRFRLNVGLARWPTASSFTPPTEFDELPTLVPVHTPTTDSPLLLRFKKTVVSRLVISLVSAGDPPEASVLYAGKLLTLPRKIYVPHTPITMAKNYNVVNPVSNSGHYLGEIILGSTSSTGFTMQNLSPTWVRTHLNPFIDDRKPFFFWWRPASYPTEGGYCWLTNTPKPQNQRNANGFMQAEFQMSGIV